MPKNHWKLDILIPTFNRPSQLHHILTTGVALRIPDVRFVVLDDGSCTQENVSEIGFVSAEAVCRQFASVCYIKSAANIGLTANLALYYQQHCSADYTLLVNDKDEFIDAVPIVNALKKLDVDPKLSVVQIPLRQKDQEQQDRPLLFSYERMTGSAFIKQYIRDNNLQHCGMYGVLRVSAIKKAGVPRSLNLRACGLEDAFGFDIDFLLMTAATGDVDFEKRPHVRRSVVGGLTERYPLTFAYCYYQYAQRVMRELHKKKVINRDDVKHYLSWWHLIMLRGLVVVYQPSDARDEKDSSRIHLHLKLPVLLYFFIQYARYGVWLSPEMKMLLFEQYLPQRFKKSFHFFKGSKTWLKTAWKHTVDCSVRKIIKPGAIRKFAREIAIYLSAVRDFGEMFRVIKESGVESAIVFLKKKHVVFRLASVRFLLELYRYLAEILRSPPLFYGRNVFFIHFCSWGESYAEKVEKYLLPSLLAPGNLPAIAAEHRVVVLIHCDEATRNKLAHSVVVKAIERYAQLEFLVLPSKLMRRYRACTRYPNWPLLKELNHFNANLKYFFLGGLQTLALQISLIHKRPVSFMMPDFLLSDNFFSRCFSKIENKKVVVMTTFRTDYEKVREQLEKFYVTEKASLVVSADSLSHLQVTHMHPAASRRVVAKTARDFISTAQLIFEAPDGFVIRALHYHPVLLDCSKIEGSLSTDYLPIDNSVLSQILSADIPYDQQVAACHDSSETSVMELSNPEVEPPPRDAWRRKTDLTYAELLKLVSDMIVLSPAVFDQPLNRYFVSIRSCVRRLPSIEVPVVKDEIINDEVFFADLTRCQ